MKDVTPLTALQALEHVNWRDKHRSEQTRLEKLVSTYAADEGAEHMANHLRRSRYILNKQPRMGSQSETYEERDVVGILWTVRDWSGESD